MMSYLASQKSNAKQLRVNLNKVRGSDDHLQAMTNQFTFLIKTTTSASHLEFTLDISYSIKQQFSQFIRQNYLSKPEAKLLKLAIVQRLKQVSKREREQQIYCYQDETNFNNKNKQNQDDQDKNKQSQQYEDKQAIYEQRQQYEKQAIYEQSQQYEDKQAIYEQSQQYEDKQAIYEQSQQYDSQAIDKQRQQYDSQAIDKQRQQDEDKQVIYEQRQQDNSQAIDKQRQQDEDKQVIYEQRQQDNSQAIDKQRQQDDRQVIYEQNQQGDNKQATNEQRQQDKDNQECKRDQENQYEQEPSLRQSNPISEYETIQHHHYHIQHQHHIIFSNQNKNTQTLNEQQQLSTIYDKTIDNGNKSICSQSYRQQHCYREDGQFRLCDFNQTFGRRENQGVHSDCCGEITEKQVRHDFLDAFLDGGEKGQNLFVLGVNQRSSNQISSEEKRNYFKLTHNKQQRQDKPKKKRQDHQKSIKTRQKIIYRNKSQQRSKQNGKTSSTNQKTKKSPAQKKPRFAINAQKQRQLNQMIFYRLYNQKTVSFQQRISPTKIDSPSPKMVQDIQVIQRAKQRMWQKYQYFDQNQKKELFNRLHVTSTESSFNRKFPGNRQNQSYSNEIQYVIGLSSNKANQKNSLTKTKPNMQHRVYNHSPSQQRRCHLHCQKFKFLRQEQIQNRQKRQNQRKIKQKVRARGDSSLLKQKIKESGECQCCHKVLIEQKKEMRRKQDEEEKKKAKGKWSKATYSTQKKLAAYGTSHISDVLQESYQQLFLST